MSLPVGPEVDTAPRPIPVHAKIAGRYAVLEPLHRRIATDRNTTLKRPRACVRALRI